MLNNVLKSAMLCAFALILVACASPVYKLYEGGRLNPEQVAVLVNNSGFERDYSLNIFSVDGIKPSDAGWNKHFYGSKLNGSYRIELLPGKHKVSVKYRELRSGTLYLSPSQEITFYVEAGKVYTLLASIDYSKRTFKVWAEEVDKNFDEYVL